MHLDHFGEILSIGAWSTFSYTLLPPPSGTASVSNLSVIKGDGGDWTTTGAAAITGTISGTNLRAVEVKIGTNVSRTEVMTAVAFTSILPGGLDYETATTIEVRAISYLTIEKMNVAGSWSTLSVTPTAPAVTSFALKNGVTGGVSSDITLRGTVSSTAVDAAYSEIEIYSGTTVYARTWCDENGVFEVTPMGLPIVNGYAEATLYVRSVKTKLDGTKVYGTALSQYVKYTPPASPVVTSISLDEPISSGSNSTTTPSVTALSTVALDTETFFAFEYKTSGDWSTPKIVPGWTQSSDNEDRTTDIVEGNYRISGLHNLPGSTTTVTVRACTAIWDNIKEDYVYGSWYTYSFTYIKPVDSLVSIDTFELANLTDKVGNTTSDPTVTGTIINDDDVSGLRVEIYQGTTLLGTTQTDENGVFDFTPSGLTNGNITLSAKVREWNYISRNYQYSDLETLSFILTDLVVIPPAVQEFTIADTTGTGNTTANPYLTGKIVADNGFVNRVKVEFDHDGDGSIDGYTYTESDSTFRYLPTLSPGNYTIHARSSSLNTHTNQWIPGDWSSCTLTVVTSSANWTPQIDTIITVTGTANSSGIMVTDLPAIMGQISSEGGYANLTVECDTDGDSMADDMLSPDQLGRFAWKDTTLSAPTSIGQMISLNVHAVYTDPTTQTSTAGSWTSYTYIYRDSTTEASLDYATIARNTDSDYDEAYKITGVITAGTHGVQSYVELDYRGTGFVNGIAVPNSAGMFTFYVTPEKPNIRMRVVEILADGSRHYPTQLWETLSVTKKPYNPGASSTTSEDLTLSLVPLEEYQTTGVILQIDGIVPSGYTYNSYRISVDFDCDGTADIQLTPDDQGRITQSMIDEAVRMNITLKLPDGLILCPAWLTRVGSETVISESLMPYIRRGELTDTEYAAYLTEQENFHDTIEAYHDTLQDAVDATVDNENIDIQYTDDPETTDETDNSTTIDERSSTGISAADRDRILNAEIPEIPAPQFTSELPELTSDPAYQDAVGAIYDTYLANINTAKETFRDSYDAIAKNYEETTGNAWESYAKTYDRLLKEYQKIEAESVTDTKAWTEMRESLSKQLQALSEKKEAKYDQIFDSYHSASEALSAAQTAACAGTCDNSCNGNYHSEACQVERIHISQQYALLHTNLIYEYELQYAELNAWNTQERLNITAANSREMISFRANFERDKADRLLVISDQIAAAGKSYQIAIANAKNTALTSIASHIQTYRNAVTSAWSTAANDTYSAAVSVLTNWAQSTGTDSDWSTYVLDIVDNAITEANSVISAYTTQATSDSAAEKTASLTQTNALLVADIAIATRNETDAKAAARAQIQLVKSRLTATELYENDIIQARVKTAADQASTWRNAAKSILNTDKSYQKQIMGYSHSTVNAIRPIQKNYENGLITYEQYIEQTSEVYTTYGRLAETARVRQNQDFLRRVLSYHETMQSSQRKFSTGAVNQYETYENTIANSLGTYWKALIDIDSDASSNYVTVCSTYTSAVNGASDTYSSSVLNAEKICETSSLSAAQTKENADNTDECSWFSTVMTSFADSISDVYDNISDTFIQTLAGDDFDNIQSCFSTELSGSFTLIGSLISNAVSLATTAINRGFSLAGSLLSSAATWISAANSAVVTADQAAISESERLSDLEIDARIEYYEDVSAAESRYQKRMISTSTTERLRTMRYINVAAIQELEHDIDEIQDREYNTNISASLSSWYYGVFGMGINFDIPFTFGSYWQSSDYVDLYDDDPGYQLGIASAYYGFYSGGYNNPVTTSSSSYYFGDNLLGYGSRQGIAGTIADLKAGVDGFEAIADFWGYAANRQLDADKFDALGDYQKTYASLSRQATSKGFELSGTLNTSLQSASTTYSSSLWNSCDTYNTALQNASQNDTTLSTLLSAEQSSLTAQLNLEKAYASNFGDYQIAWRTSLNTGTEDITWATNVDAARTAYMNLLCSEIIDYAETVYDAVEDYADAMETANNTYSNSIFDAAHTYDTALTNAENTYSNSVFNAQKTATLAYYDAAIEELTQSIDFESQQKASEIKHANELAQTRETVLLNLFEDLSQIPADDDTGFEDWLDEIQSAGTNAKIAYTTDQTARSTRNATRATALTDKKSALAAKREKQEFAADKQYKESEQSAWNTYTSTTQTANTTYLNYCKAAGNTYKSATDAAETTYDTTTITAYTDYHQSIYALDTAFYAAIADANEANFTTTTYFTTTDVNANLPYQKTAFTAKMVDSTESSISTVGKTDEEIRGAARNVFGKARLPTGWHVHYVYPVRLVRKFEELGIDINTPENLRAVHPKVHSYITAMQNEWFNGKIKVEFDTLKQLKKYRNSSAKKILEQATQNVYAKITLDEINTFNNVVERSFGDYLAKAQPQFFDSGISTVVKRTTTFLKEPDEVTKLANGVRSKLGLKILSGAAVIFAFIDSFAMASEIYNPSIDSQGKLTTMMDGYTGCMDAMQHKGYIKKNQWSLLESATLDYLNAINADTKIISSVQRLFELEGSQLPD